MISVFVLEMKRGKTEGGTGFAQGKNSDSASSECSREHLVDPAGLLCCALTE